MLLAEAPRAPADSSDRLRPTTSMKMATKKPGQRRRRDAIQQSSAHVTSAASKRQVQTKKIGWSSHCASAQTNPSSSARLSHGRTTVNAFSADVLVTAEAPVLDPRLLHAQSLHTFR